jgi:hypothetical protein
MGLYIQLEQIGQLKSTFAHMKIVNMEMQVSAFQVLTN